MPEKIAQLQRQYGLKEIIFVGDRDMITAVAGLKLTDYFVAGDSVVGFRPYCAD